MLNAEGCHGHGKQDATQAVQVLHAGSLMCVTPLVILLVAVGGG